MVASHVRRVPRISTDECEPAHSLEFLCGRLLASRQRLWKDRVIGRMYAGRGLIKKEAATIGGFQAFFSRNKPSRAQRLLPGITRSGPNESAKFTSAICVI